MHLQNLYLKNSYIIQNKKLLELAAGLGLPSMVAGKFAHSVYCSDYIIEAVETAQATAEFNKLDNVECVQLNWENIPVELKADVLLLSDVKL